MFSLTAGVTRNGAEVAIGRPSGACARIRVPAAVVRAFEFVQALPAKGLAIGRHGRVRRPGLVARFQSAWDTLARSHVCTTSARAWTAVQLEVSLRQLAAAEVVITLPEPEPLQFPPYR